MNFFSNKEDSSIKRAKLEQIIDARALVSYIDNKPNFLSEETIKEFNIGSTETVSAHGYDPYALNLIEKHSTGLVLDCGAGYRSTVYPNVINLEIVNYPSTDVLAPAERLPFKDNSFDAVLSLNVLEHLSDPFQAAREISRVLKPGGELYCVVPFLQPRHGFPNHFYNMTAEGLKNLIYRELQIDRQEMLGERTARLDAQLDTGALAQRPPGRRATGVSQPSRGRFDRSAQSLLATLLGHSAARGV